MITFTFFDWLWSSAFLVLMVGGALVFYRLARRSESDFFLAGRKLPWWLPASSVFSTHTATDIKFLDDLWPYDPEAVSTLQEIIGYCLTLDTRQQKLFMIVGPKRSGKGTIGRVQTALLGRANVCGPTLASFGTNFGLAPLIGKQLAIISDARLGSRPDHHGRNPQL